VNEERQHDSEVRALRQLVDELRDETPPPLDWDGMEQRLLGQIDLEARARRARPAPWSSLVAFAAAAAAVALLITRLGAAPAPGPTDPVTVVDLDQLPAGQTTEGSTSYPVAALPAAAVVRSQDRPLRFTLPGVVTWELAPHSEVVVHSGSVPHLLTLQRGAVSAEVVPRHDTDRLVETFAIEAGTTRVAVHGTAFSVARHDDHLAVTVAHGTVALGPTGHRGITSRHLLTSPARARVSLRGGVLLSSPPVDSGPLLARLPEPPAPTGQDPLAPPPLAATPAVPDSPDGANDAPTAPPSPQGDPAVADVPPSPPASENGAAEPPAAELPPALDRNRAQALVLGCVRAAADGADTSSKTKVTINSRVTVTASDAGTVGAVRFDPPLRPDLQQRCGAALFGQRMAPGTSLAFVIQVAGR